MTIIVNYSKHCFFKPRNTNKTVKKNYFFCSECIHIIFQKKNGKYASGDLTVFPCIITDITVERCAFTIRHRAYTKHDKQNALLSNINETGTQKIYIVASATYVRWGSAHSTSVLLIKLICGENVKFEWKKAAVRLGSGYRAPTVRSIAGNPVDRRAHVYKPAKR